MNAERKESALSRWSRRKLETKQQTRESERQPGAQATEATSVHPVEPAAESEKPVLTDADMPAVESLDEDSDYSLFMSSGVSDELRNLALRKLFRAPVFNIRDGLDEYDDDFTTFEKLGDVITADMKHRLEMEQEKLRTALAEKEPVDDEGEDQDDEVVEAPGEEAATDAVEAPPREDDDKTRRVAQLDPDAAPREPGDER